MLMTPGEGGGAFGAALDVLLAGNSRDGCWMGLGLLVVAVVGDMAMGGKLGLGGGLRWMGGGGRGGNVGVAEGVGVGGDGLGETPIAKFCCADGLDAALVGAEAIWACLT